MVDLCTLRCTPLGPFARLWSQLSSLAVRARLAAPHMQRRPTEGGHITSRARPLAQLHANVAVGLSFFASEMPKRSFSALIWSSRSF